MDRATERDLIERAIAGERAAAGELIKAHQRSVYGYILRMSIRHGLCWIYGRQGRHARRFDLQR